MTFVRLCLTIPVSSDCRTLVFNFASFENLHPFPNFFHFVNFSLKRRLLYEPVGLWPILPPGAESCVRVYPTILDIVDSESSEEDEIPQTLTSQDYPSSSTSSLAQSAPLRVGQPTFTRAQLGALADEWQMTSSDVLRILSSDQ
eukprot:GGOE01011244.1.p1 GENE.GGOE01011244.1~~GGOE01011244.1.p1  ORF type:complete len:144 (+),score=1.76 GGOE01011244.1:603-1034(+)